jgi:hypothetical protein
LSLAAITSMGAPWPDGTASEEGSVIVLSAEDDAEDTIRPRLEAAGADLQRVYVLDAVRQLDARNAPELRPFSLEKDIAKLRELLASKLQDVTLIIIDPISAYLGAADSHNNAEVRALLARLAELAAQHGVAIVCVSHLNKSTATEALLRVQGSIAFGAAPRAVWGVARDRTDARRRLFLPLKSNLGSDDTGFAFTVDAFQLGAGIETSRIKWEGEPVLTTAAEAFAADVNDEERSALAEAEAFLRDELADGAVRQDRVKADAAGTGIAWRTVERAKKILAVKASKDGMKGPWYWQMPVKTAKMPEECQP